MSLHKDPRFQTPEIVQSLKNHGLNHDMPSQLADCFRTGWSAALAAQAGHSEPVAWGDLARHNGYLSRSKSDAELYNENCFTLTPLYTEPAPVRQPLTDDEIGAIHVACGTPRALHIEFARAIEAAHGIAQPKDKS